MVLGYFDTWYFGTSVWYFGTLILGTFLLGFGTWELGIAGTLDEALRAEVPNGCCLSETLMIDNNSFQPQ